MSLFAASVVKAVLRYGKKQFVVDETRRDSYKLPVTSGNEGPLLTTVEDEVKQLLAVRTSVFFFFFLLFPLFLIIILKKSFIVSILSICHAQSNSKGFYLATKFTFASFCINQVGIHMKHSYARSLAHFASDLGPVVWKIAASKISSVLPTGHEFGPGWVSENDEPQKQHFPVCDEGRTSDPPVVEDCKSRFSSPSGSLPLANRSCMQSADMVINNYQKELNSAINIAGGSESITPVKIQQESMPHPDDFGSHDWLGSNFSPQMKMVRLADLTGSPGAGVAPQMDPISGRIAQTNTNPSLLGQYGSKSSQLESGNLLARESGFEPRSWSQGIAGKSSWQGLEVPTKQKSFALSNDLNGRIGTTNSPSSSNVEAGSQLQPNLALQL